MEKLDLSYLGIAYYSRSLTDYSVFGKVHLTDNASNFTACGKHMPSNGRWVLDIVIRKDQLKYYSERFDELTCKKCKNEFLKVFNSYLLDEDKTK